MTSPNRSTRLAGSATPGDGYAPSGTIHFNRYSPSGSAVDKETATIHANGSYSTATGYTGRPRERRPAPTSGTSATGKLKGDITDIRE